MFERFDIDKHGPIIGQWYRDRGLLIEGDGDAALYPPTGFVVNGILASFVYLTNSALAYIDNTVADPHSSKEARRAATQEMLPLLVEEARSHGVKALCTSVYMHSLESLLNEHGFTPLPQTHTLYLRRL